MPLYFLQHLQHNVVRLKDLFKLVNNSDTPIHWWVQVMYFYSWGQPMHLQNHKLQTCKKRAISVRAFHKYQNQILAVAWQSCGFSLLCQVFPNNCWETLIIFSQIRLDNYVFIMNMTSLAWLTVNTVSSNWSETYLPISNIFYHSTSIWKVLSPCHYTFWSGSDMGVTF